MDRCGARGNGKEASIILRNRYEGRSEARVRSLLAEVQKRTLQPCEDPDVYIARLCRLRVYLQQVGCIVDDYQLQTRALSGLSAEYTPTLKQLRTMQSLGLTMMNDMLREAYVTDILPNEAKNDPLRIYRSEGAMPTTTKKRLGKKRDLSDLVCHNCKKKGQYSKKCRSNKPLRGDTTTKWCSVHKTRSHSDNECMAPQKNSQ